MPRREKILVTGGSGKIGRFIIDQMKKEYDLVVFDMQKPNDEDAGFIKGDIRNYQSLDSAAREMDGIIHLAGYYTESIMPSYLEGWEVNCTGTFNVFESAVRNKVRRVVFASSIAATGILTWTSCEHGIEYFPVDELHPCNPETLYGVGKLAAEKVARMYSERSNTSFICLRMASAWYKSEGQIEEQTRQQIDTYIKDPTNALRVSPPPDKKREYYVIEDPRAGKKDLTWQYVDARDVAQAFSLAIKKKDIKYGIYNIGAADTPSKWDSLKLAQFFYPDVPIRNAVAFLIDKKRALWDISRAQRELGYRPLHNSEEWNKFL
jgi:nucleoside-diphosphate-sugar epimerase